MKCSKCKDGEYKEIDREVNSDDKTYILLECEKCQYSVIVPETKGEN